jgi:hypothetical protein
VYKHGGKGEKVMMGNMKNGQNPKITILLGF